jgi:hypothetical protein
MGNEKKKLRAYRERKKEEKKKHERIARGSKKQVEKRQQNEYSGLLVNGLCSRGLALYLFRETLVSLHD